MHIPIYPNLHLLSLSIFNFFILFSNYASAQYMQDDGASLHNDKAGSCNIYITIQTTCVK